MVDGVYGHMDYHYVLTRCYNNPIPFCKGNNCYTVKMLARDLAMINATLVNR